MYNLSSIVTMGYENRRHPFDHFGVYEPTVKNTRGEILLVVIVIIVVCFIMAIICEYFNQLFPCLHRSQDNNHRKES